MAGADYETAVIPEERKKYLKRFDAKAAHFEVVAEKRPAYEVGHFKGKRGSSQVMPFNAVVQRGCEVAAARQAAT